MTPGSYKLICEAPDERTPLEVLMTESSLNHPREIFVKGPYMGGGIVNKNNRLYPIEEMRPAVQEFIENKVKKHTATGELNHPTHGQIDLKQAAHMIVEMYEDNGVWYGKSKILNGTPNGEMMKALLNNGVAIGMSSRCLGQIEEGSTYNIVHNMKVVTIDAVAEPSFDKAFVNGILESKEFVCEADGSFKVVNLYKEFEDKLSDLPRSGTNQYILDGVIDFLKSFNL